MTRRNKVRLAVSWWKAIQTNEWHKKYEESEKNKNLNIEDKYNFNAIKNLLLEAALAEAGMQEFFNKNSITPYTIFYEDFIKDFNRSIKDILSFLEINYDNLNIGKPFYAKLADDISEKWCIRFSKELQKNWKNKGWDVK